MYYRRVTTTVFEGTCYAVTIIAHAVKEYLSVHISEILYCSGAELESTADRDGIMVLLQVPINPHSAATLSLSLSTRRKRF